MPQYPNNEFIGACIEFDELIAKLQAARAEHFGVDPEAERTWDEVAKARRGVLAMREALLGFATVKMPRPTIVVARSNADIKRDRRTYHPRG